LSEDPTSGGTPPEDTSPTEAPEARNGRSADFHCTREYLGLSLEWVATALDVALRNARRWDHGFPAPEGVSESLDDWFNDAEVLESDLVRRRGTTIVTYRTDQDWATAEPDSEVAKFYPASFHRALAFRASLEFDGVSVVFFEPTAG
jgi:hypothetical protein